MGVFYLKLALYSYCLPMLTDRQMLKGYNAGILQAIFVINNHYGYAFNDK